MTSPCGEWVRAAACATGPATRLPWTADAPTLPQATVAAMRAVCDDCPVLGACTAYVDTAAITGGWWAGADRDALAHQPEQLDLLDLLGGAA